jgi:alpha-1,2-mannosyltransferase
MGQHAHNGRIDQERQAPSASRPSQALVRPLTLWTLGSVSAVVLALYVAVLSRQRQIDFDVYRMGGQHVFGPGLYTSYLTVLGRDLVFTYPPLAALFFWPLSHLSTFAGQIVWDAIDLFALTALIAVSIAAARDRSLVRSDWRTALVVLFPLGFLLFPVRENLELGQINIVLVLMIVADLTIGVSWGDKRLPRGVLVGLAAAVKLTPLIFLPYLVATRQWRSARNMTLGFSLATGAMFAVSPRASWLYFTRDALDVKRVGGISQVINQTLHAAIVRAHLSPSRALVDLFTAVLLCGGIAVAVVAHRRSSALLGVLLCAATGLMVSPISWLHHYVWVVPALVWLVAGVDRPAKGVQWALGVAVVFIVIPPTPPADSNVLWYLRENSYVLLTLGFIGLSGMMLWARGRSPARNATPFESHRDTQSTSDACSLTP